MDENNRIENKQRLYNSQAIAELLERHTKRKLSQANSKSGNTPGFDVSDISPIINEVGDKLKDIVDINNDNQIDIDDLKLAFNKVGNFLETLGFLDNDDSSSNVENLVKNGPVFVDDEVGVVSSVACPRCSDYASKKAFEQCKECEQVDNMRERSANITAALKVDDIEAQIPFVENEPKPGKVKRFRKTVANGFKASGRNIYNQIRPRDKSRDVHYIHRFRFFPVGPF